MRLITILLLALASYGAWNWWQGRDGAAPSVEPSPNGFVAVEMPGGAGRDTVLVLAPPNCPSDQARRTESLVQALAREGIPVARGSGFSFDVDDPSPEQIANIDRAVAVFKQGAPAVFVNGMAMSNPSAAQTVAEYRRTRGAAR